MTINIGDHEKSLDPFSFTTTAWQVLKRRYLIKNEKNEVIETPIDMFKRVANSVANNDKQYGIDDKDIAKTAQEFFDMMVDMKFLSGMALRNAGREVQQLSACYVFPIEDSMESIYTTLKNAAFVHKTGAGIGYDFSKLRPREDIVNSTGGKSSGPISFMKLFDFSCETIVNNAATRRAGNMGILRIDHPDIEEFIHAKENNSELNNFNLSVAITDQFMEAVKLNKDFDLINPKTKKVTKTVKANDLFNLIVKKAWEVAEPGIIFIDQINRHNPTLHIGKMESTNQCGEQPLLPYEACNLGSIVLSNVVKQVNPKEYEINWDELYGLVHKAVHFLDNMIDINYYSLPQIKDINLANRKIGLGVMGFADLLIKLKIPYNSNKALETAEKIMKFIQDTSKEASVKLAKERGSFPNFIGSKWEQEGYKFMRNATTTTIAPNGTTSIFANCSSGIEPLFALVYIRKNILEIGKDEFIETHPYFENVAKENWFYSKNILEQVSAQGGVQNIPNIPQEVKDIFVVSHDMDPIWHVRMQASFQKHTDNAVSKTVNMPNNVTTEDVKEIFLKAYELGCKGTTVYRDGSRSSQVLNLKK